MSQRAGSVKLGSRRRWCMVRSPPLDDDSSACSFRVRLAGSDRTIAPAGLMCGRRCPLSDGPNTTTTTTGVVRWRAVDYRSADDPARGRRRREKVTFGLDTASASGVGKRRDARAAGPAPGVWGSERDDFWNPSWVRLCLLVGGFKVFFFQCKEGMGLLLIAVGCFSLARPMGRGGLGIDQYKELRRTRSRGLVKPQWVRRK